MLDWLRKILIHGELSQFLTAVKFFFIELHNRALEADLEKIRTLGHVEPVKTDFHKVKSSSLKPKLTAVKNFFMDPKNMSNKAELERIGPVGQVEPVLEKSWSMANFLNF